MSLGLRDNRRRRRQRLQWSLFKWMVALALVGAAGFYAYETGRKLAAMEIDRLEGQIAALEGRLAATEAERDGALQAAAAARGDTEEWRRRYEHDVAKGPAKELFELLQSRLAAGVEADRIKSVLSQTQNRRDCRVEPGKKNYEVFFREQRKPRPTVTFARGEVIFSVEGVGARDAAGNPEAWFDSAQPVTIRMVRPGGGSAEAAGVLPLFPTQIVGEREYRFSVVPNRTRGIVDIAVESCRFP